MKNCFFILLGLIFLFGCRKDNQDPTTIENNLNLENTGDFIFDSYPTANSKPVAVFFHIPNGIDKSYAPILFVLPGMNRNAEEYRDSWIELANQFQFMVFSLEFSNQFFPNSNAYQEGFVFNENGFLNDESVWTFSFIEPIFDKIKEALNHQNNTYDIFGHSADMSELRKIANEYGLKIISDTAQAPGSYNNGQYSSTFADIGGFSLNYHKHIHTGEGGILITNNSKLAKRMQLIRNHAEAAAEGMGEEDISNLITI